MIEFRGKTTHKTDTKRRSNKKFDINRIRFSVQTIMFICVFLDPNINIHWLQKAWECNITPSPWSRSVDVLTNGRFVVLCRVLYAAVVRVSGKASECCRIRCRWFVVLLTEQLHNRHNHRCCCCSALENFFIITLVLRLKRFRKIINPSTIWTNDQLLVVVMNLYVSVKGKLDFYTTYLCNNVHRTLTCVEGFLYHRHSREINLHSDK